MGKECAMGDSETDHEYRTAEDDKMFREKGWEKTTHGMFKRDSKRMEKKKEKGRKGA